MKEKNNIPQNDALDGQSVTEKKPSKRRLFTVLISLLVALSLLTAAFAVLTFVDFSDDGKTGSGGSGTATGTAFDYFNAPYADYITLTESMLKGLTLPGYDSRIDEATPENVEKYINRILLNAVALSDNAISQKSYSSEVKWADAIDYADDVFLYIVRVEKDGATVDTKFFEKAYMEPGRVQIGMEYFGESFDKALMALKDKGLTPANTGSFEKRTKGDVKADDVILVTYTATETVKATEEGKSDTVKNHKNYENLRLDLSTVEDAAWRDALLASYGTVGQYFAFEYEEDVNGDGTKEKLKYEGVINAVIYNEETYPLVATLPEDFFGENPTDETYAALNGAELTFHIVIDHMVPHDANTVDTMTKADIDTINAYLSENGLLTFSPSNDVTKIVNGNEQKGELTNLTTTVSTLESEKKKLEAEIETLEGDNKKLSGEITAMEEELAKMKAAPDAEAKAQEIATKEKAIETNKTTLETKKAELAKKKETLLTKQTSLEAEQASLDAALAVARKECREFFKKELDESYPENVKMTKGQIVYEYLVQNLTFIKLPESEVEAVEQYAKELVEYCYSQLSVSELRNYRDIDDYCARMFPELAYYEMGVYVDYYDEQDYDSYADYIESYFAPYVIKSQLLIPMIYNTFINDESKLNAKIEAHVADLVEIQAALGKPMTRDEIVKNYETNAGKDYLRNYYAMRLVVYDYLADNNNVDFTLREIENK